MCCGLTWELSCFSCFSKMPKYDKPPLRSIFRRSTNTSTLHKFKDKNPVKRYRSIIQHFVHSKCYLDAPDVFTDCSTNVTAIATRALAALLLLETITLPPLRPRRVLTGLGGRHTVEPEQTGPGEKHIFWTSTCAGFLKHNTGRHPQTGLQCMVYLSSAPHSYAMFDSATSVSWRKLQETGSPGTLHGRYPQQGCGPVQMP